MTEYKEINFKELQQIYKNKDVTLLDVREPEEFSEAAIPGSVNIPLATFDDVALAQIHNNDVVIYCLAGKRAQMACQKILNSSDKNIHLYYGSIKDWHENGGELV